MLPLQIPGIALVGKMLVSRYNSGPSSNDRKLRLKPSPSLQYLRIKAPDVANQFQKVFRSLTSSLSQITKGTTREDYNAVVNSFIPRGARLIKPQYPYYSQGIELADIDGDSHDELIASFRHDNEIGTIILKKQDGIWSKIGEINNTEYDTLHYRGVANISGKGKNQLLMNFKSKGKIPGLYCYSFENNNLNELFCRNCHRFEVVKQNRSKDDNQKAQLALWYKKEEDLYDINVLNWNGTQFEPTENTANYYYKNVAPYYARKLKRNPYAPSGWYNLAEALVKAGANKDALIAIDVGTRLDKDSRYKEDFSALRSEILM